MKNYLIPLFVSLFLFPNFGLSSPPKNESALVEMTVELSAIIEFMAKSEKKPVLVTQTLRNELKKLKQYMVLPKELSNIENRFSQWKNIYIKALEMNGFSFIETNDYIAIQLPQKQ